MRHLLLIIMIALLPLRGWASDVMATSMAATRAQHISQTATKTIATGAHRTSAKAHFDSRAVATKSAQIAADCSGHDSGNVSFEAATHCDSCSACQACHTVALSSTSVDATAAFNLSTLPRAAAAQFASAPVALGKKPPIS